MTNQPILDELHAVREKMLADADGSLAVLIEKLRAAQSKSGREIRKSRITNDSTEDRGTSVEVDSHSGLGHCLLYTSPSPRDATLSRMPSSA